MPRTVLKVDLLVAHALLFWGAGIITSSPGLCELCRQKEQIPFEETCNYVVDGANFEATSPLPMRESGPFEDVSCPNIIYSKTT